MKEYFQKQIDKYKSAEPNNVNPMLIYLVDWPPDEDGSMNLEMKWTNLEILSDDFFTGLEFVEYGSELVPVFKPIVNATNQTIFTNEKR